MKLIHRIGYFSVGLFMGIVILIFFLSGKKTSCNYFPNARVLMNLRSKGHEFSEESLKFFSNNQLDTSIVADFFQDGDIDFGKSETHSEPCKTYYISRKADNRNLELKVQNCDSLATIQDAQFLKEN
ncbi:MAG: hypothetical protein WCE57_04055 [Salegentibacter sp.]